MSRALRLVGGLAALIGVGTVLLMLNISSSTAGRPLSFGAACFTAVSALATTGLSVITPGADLSLFGQLVLLALMQIGGIGLTIVAVLVFRLLGRRVTLQERLALRDSLGLVSRMSIAELALRVIMGVVAVEAVGAVLLWLVWWPKLGAGSAAYQAVWHSVSAFTNSSFDLFSGSPTAAAGFPTDTLTLMIISSLVILGSIGVPVLADLLSWSRSERSSFRLSLHSRITLVTAAILLVLGTVALFLGSNEHGVLFSNEPWPRKLLMAYFHSATSRTSGFVLVPLEEMSHANVLVLCVLMFIGGSPASMGGGITTSTVAVLALTLAASVRGRDRVEVAGRTIPRETITKAAAILSISLTFVMLMTWLILMTQEATLNEALFETISAFATCGFTLGLTPRLDGLGQFLIAFSMFAGRLGLLTLVAALTEASISYPLSFPEEKILIG